MKLILSVEHDIATTLSTLAEVCKYSKKENSLEIRSYKSRLNFLNDCKRYLQTSPSELFIIQQRDSCYKKLTCLMERFKPLSSSAFSVSEIRKHRDKYEKLSGVSDIKRHLEYLNYLLETH
jgi:hypothetical protein